MLLLVAYCLYLLPMRGCEGFIGGDLAITVGLAAVSVGKGLVLGAKISGDSWESISILSTSEWEQLLRVVFALWHVCRWSDFEVDDFVWL